MRVLSLPTIVVCLVLSVPQPGSAGSGDVLVPRSDLVRLYEAPTSTAPVVRELDRGHRLLEFQRDGDWIKVVVFRLVGGRGWVRSADVVAEREAREHSPAPSAPHQGERPGDEASTRFLLDIDGTPAIGFRASCRIVTPEGEEQGFEFAGLLPDQAVAEAGAISCVVRKADVRGRLRATLLIDGVQLAAAETRAAFNWVRVRSDGPWGPAQAVRGSVAVVLPEVTRPSRRGRTIVPPMGNPVPALRKPTGAP
jgi:hypothetical protein